MKTLAWPISLAVGFVSLMEIAGPALADAAAPPVAAKSGGAMVPIESYTLPNGLRVVFHIDRSDPVVAVVLADHVGSAREEPRRTGFAHLFEHLFFLDSENLGPGGLDKMSARIGGSGANGSTSRDLTNYHQTVPRDALEKMIWAEADKLGYFVNTVSDAVIAKEKEVVKNEKRQSVDNEPYGHTETVISEALYPPDHPYSWTVIGSLADLNAATLADVKQFYRRWYTPDNATLVIAGDFEPAQAKAWVQKYFGEIKRGPGAPRPRVRPASLKKTIRLMHEDSFAELPELTLAWPGVERASPDRAALQVLMSLLTEGREAPLHAVLVDEKKVTDSVDGSAKSDEIAGEVYLTVRAFSGVDLDTVQAALDEGFQRFEKRGVDAAALGRIKTMAEADFYGRLDSVLGKARALATYSLLGGSTDEDLAQLKAVSATDVMRVYKKLLAGRPHVVTSFVPKAKTQLALANSTVARVVEEAVVQGAEAPVNPNATKAAFERTPSSFDRTVEPPAGAAPVISPPVIWQKTLGNGLSVSGIANAEVPLANFALSMDGGRLFDDPAKPGAANLLARLFKRGTKTRTPVQLENDLKALGASIGVQAEEEHFVIRGRTLYRNLARTLALVEEMLLEPRWDPAELALVKDSTRAEIQAARAEPAALADRVMNLVTYGDAHVLSRSALGTERAVSAITMEDLKALAQKALAPNRARLYVVSPGDEVQVTAALGGLSERWARREGSVPTYPIPLPPAESHLYFYDVPGAKQSVLLFGYPALRRAEADFYPCVVMNYRLGGGGFASRLTQELRESKGYTYGIHSGFHGGAHMGQFELESDVRSNVTLEAVTLARSIMTNYGATFTEEDLDVTRNALARGRARSFETATAKLGVLEAIGEEGLPPDYLKRESAVIETMTLKRINALAAKYLRPGAMNYVVVGDAATQAARLEGLGLGKPVMMNERIAKADK